MPTIFISYRRSDNPDAVGRIYDALCTVYGRESVFIDIDDIPLGENFPAILNEKLSKADLVMVVIGDQWLERDENGSSKLEDPNDFVRIEIETALNSNVPVIPVVVGDAPLPKPIDLPEAIRELCQRNATPVRSGINFAGHMQRLIKSIDAKFPRQLARHKKTGRYEKRASDNAAGLSALRRSASNGGRILAAGTVSLVLAWVLERYFLAGPGGLLFLTPSDFARPILGVIMLLLGIGVACGWFGWGSLRQGVKQMYMLEFERGVNPAVIQDTLTGASLVSMSMLFVKVISFIAILASGGVISVYLFLAHEFPELFAKTIGEAALLTVTMVAFLPYVFVIASVRMRYFQPSNWDSAGWFFRLIWSSKSTTQAGLPQPSNSKIDPAIEARMAEDLAEYQPTAIALAMHKIMRKCDWLHLLKVFFDDSELEEEFGIEYFKILSSKILELCDRYSAMSPSDLADFYDELQGEASKFGVRIDHQSSWVE